MAPQVLKIQEQEEKKKETLNNVKEGTVSKIKTEVRTKKSQDPIHIKKEEIKTTTKVVKRNYNLNKLSQVRKMVFKNKTVAPTNVTHHANDILVKYSPAVFKNAVEAVTERWEEGAKYESDKLKLEVVKRRKAVDQSGAKVDSLVVFRMSSKQGAMAKIIQTIHIYNTTHSIMIQGARLLNGIKGCKCFLEDFLQTELEKEIQSKKSDIEMTEELLNNVKLPEPEKEKKEHNSNKTSREFKFNCDMCEARFRTSEALKEHEEKKHIKAEAKVQLSSKSVVIEVEFICDGCEEKFPSIALLEEHDENVHSKKEIKSKEERSTKLNISCESCDKIFEDNSEALKHMLLEHKEKNPDTEKEAERVINMVRSITEKIINDVNVSDEKKESSSTSDLKRAHSVSPPMKIQTSKRDKKEQPKEITNKEDDNKTLDDELANTKKGAKLLEKDLSLMEKKITQLTTEALEKEEDVRLLKEENIELKREAQQHKCNMKKVEDDAMEVVLKVSESLRGDIEKKKEEVVGAWKEFNKLKKYQEEKYKLIVEENVKIGEEMAKMQEERDLAQAKVESLEAISKAKKYDANLRQFSEDFPAGCSTSTKDDAMDTGETVNECIKISSCIGDCDNLKLDQLRRLKELKDSGSNRRSPQVKPENKPENKSTNKTTFKCKHCNFTSETKNTLETHIKNTHKCNCTMCGGTERNMTNLDQHFRNFHERRDQRTKGPCRYHNQLGGCKKGDQCDFDHQGSPTIKIPKLCRSGQSCTWKPCCKFIHLEDGDQMPDQRTTQMRIPERIPNQRPMNIQQRLSPQIQHLQQNFQRSETSQPPPGVIQESVGASMEDRKKWLSPPSLQSLTQFPNLPKRGMGN